MPYTYNEKYVLVIKMSADSSTFLVDAALFTRRFPRNSLNRDISRVNDITRASIHQRIINELLNYYTEEEIEQNRNHQIVSTSPKKQSEAQPSQSKEIEQPKEKERLSKYKEFPGIQWTKTDDENVSLCILLYNDRIEQYRITQELQPKLQQDPSLSERIVAAESRHYLAQQELINFNKTGDFLGRHPIIKEHLETKKLLHKMTDLKRTDPDRFSKIVSNAMKNVSRYKCEVERAETDADKESAETLLKKAQNKLTLLQTILANG